MSYPLLQLAAAQRHAGGLHTLYVRLLPGCRIDGHQHDAPTIVLVHRGTLEVTENGETVVENAGTLRLSVGFTGRTVLSRSGADCLVISCDASQAIARHAIWGRVTDAGSTRFAIGVDADPLVDVATCAARTTLQAEAHCLALLTRLLHADGEPAESPPWLERALQLLTAAEGRTGACQEVARAVGVHPVHLARVVRRFTGLTAHDFLRRARIVRASGLLRSTEESVSWIAHQSGFSDHSHFTREFVRRHGQAPSARRGLTVTDVASVQACDFPAVHLGHLAVDETSAIRHARDAACDGDEF